MGVGLSEAAAMEGFDNLDADEVEATPEPTAEEEPTAPTAERFAKWLVLDGKGAQIERDLDTEEGRATVWRGFIERVHGPAERKMALTMRRYLRAQSARISKRMADELGTKGITKAIDDHTLDRILDEAFEREQLLGIFRPLYRAALLAAFEEASRSINVDQLLSPDELEANALVEVRKMSSEILSTTGENVRDLVDKGLAEEMSLPEMQKLLTKAVGGPNRAMMIARTETTRLSNQAAVDSFRQAEQSGLTIDKQWLSARDDRVRDDHKPGIKGLDGQTVPTEGMFKTASGQTASAPGLFGIAGQDINCRCTIVGKVRR
jgi:hypothetical protein